MWNELSDLSIQLVYAQYISQIFKRLITSKKIIESDIIIKDYDKLIDLLDKVNEDTVEIYYI